MIDDIRPGVLTKEQIVILKKRNVNVIEHLNGDIDLSAFDLRLAEQGWEMKGSIKGTDDTEVTKLTKEYGKGFTLTSTKILKKRKTYVFQLEEYLKFPPDKKLFGRATGKSSIGRIDILTRLMANKSSSYDEIKEGYTGDLFLEVTPITFDVKVEKGLALSQLRLFRGNPESCELKDAELELYSGMILDETGKPKEKNICELRVNLDPDPEKNICAFKAKKRNNLLVDLTKGKKAIDPQKYWMPESIRRDKTLKIEPERFYIIRSKERFKLPLDVAVYCQAISETLGELRIHYAGFVHPGFGMDRNEGTPIIFEVRGHNVDTFLRDGEVLARIKFYRMSERCKKPGRNQKSGYENQELNLSNYFKEWQR